MPPFDGVDFEACYKRTYPLVLAKCRRMLAGHADASDMAQEVFFRLWTHRDLAEDPRALTAWLYRTSTRLVIDRARKRTLGQESLHHLQNLLQSAPEPPAEQRFVERQRLRQVMADVPEDELEAAILSRFDRLTQPEVAEVMAVSERTVRRLLARFDERTHALQEVTP
jgi:RNA polymerase sigma-70 factor, ECF subfamily